MFDSRISCRKTINNSFAHHFYVLAIEWANSFELNWQIYFTKWISNKKNTSPHRKRKVSIVKTTKIWRKFTSFYGIVQSYVTHWFGHAQLVEQSIQLEFRSALLHCLFVFVSRTVFVHDEFVPNFQITVLQLTWYNGLHKKGGPQNWVIEFINKAICSMVREQAWKSRTKKKQNNNSADKQPTEPTRKCVSCS